MLTITHASAQDAQYTRSVGHWPPSPLAEKEVEALGCVDINGLFGFSRRLFCF